MQKNNDFLDWEQVQLYFESVRQTYQELADKLAEIKYKGGADYHKTAERINEDVGFGLIAHKSMVKKSEIRLVK